MGKVTMADRIREIMTETGLRQVDIIDKCKPFADAYGTTLNKVHLSQYLSGRCEPNATKVAALSKALNVSEAWLMGFDVPRERNSSNEDFVVSDDERELIVEFRTLNDEDRRALRLMAHELKLKGMSNANNMS